jgi:arginyl-tRNA synthetase
MVTDKIREILLNTIIKLGFSSDSVIGIYDIPIDTPKIREFGHYSSNVPFSLAASLKRPPYDIAVALAESIDMSIFEKVEPAKPGFVNFTLKPASLQEVITEINENKKNYGRSDFGNGRKVQVEFVSANPTGPLSVGHGRIAVYGDTVARLLDAAGFAVHKEFYVNDAGNQINNLASSVELRMKELLGESIDQEQLGYKGEYLIAYAKEILEENGSGLLEKDEQERRAIIAESSISKMLAHQADTLKHFGVEFDTWFRERELHQSGIVERTLDIMKEKGLAYEEDGAHWFSSTDFKDEKDRVLKKSCGTPTYFLADIAYHRNKYERGFETIIDIWGADHHGYIERMKAAVGALGFDPASLEILIVQFVRFKNVKMSKRLGNIVTIDDLIDEVGADVARFFFLTRSRDSHLEFDLGLAGEKSEANPLFYLQYAHARIHSLIAKAADKNLRPLFGSELSLLTDQKELQLMKQLADFPWEIQSAAKSREPVRIIAYLTRLAGDFHAFYHDLRVISPEEPSMSGARLALSLATGSVLARGLDLLGVSAPESM